MLIGPKYYIMYCTGDMAFYFAQKLLRGDFDYWAINFDGFVRVFVSILMRVIMKTIVDHTGLVQFRAPAELGGIYWSFNMLVTVVSPLAATKLYYDTIKAGKAALEEKIAWSLTTSLCTAWLLVFVLFLKLMKKKYRKTFFSLKLGKTAIMEKFESENEEVKAAIFTKNRNLWVEIEEDVKEWVMNNWWRWKEEQPAWLTEGIIAKIPDEFIPSEESRVALNRMRRRGSFVASMSELTASRPSLKLSKQRLLTISHTIVPVIEQHEEEESGGEDKSDKSEVTRKAEATE